MTHEERKQYEINHEAMKRWNAKREKNEKEAIERFWRMNSDPILHPSKFNKNLK